MKKPWQSKTAWVNFILGALALFVPGFQEFVSENPTTSVLVGALVNFVLRFVTKEAITMSLVAVFLLSCANADIVVPEDTSLPPAKGGYDNIIIKSSQYPEWSLGQTGVSVEYGDDLRNHTVTIFSPLGGSLVVYGYECGADQTYVLSEGQFKTFTLDELVPAQAEFCTISFRMDWNNIPKVELPFEGQTGKLYVRIRDKGKAMSKMSWLPGELQEYTGLAFGQFRGLANPVGGRDQVTEPIRLNVMTSQDAGKGLFQLWSEEKQIGVKNVEFTGRHVQVERSAIVGGSKPGSYVLGGFAVGDSGLRDDLWVGINVFDPRIKKLGGFVTYTDTEVCYETENTVALTLLEGTTEPQNAWKGCFPKPTEKKVMAFFTHIGRSAIAILNPAEGTYQWKQ